ncbi:hypothetical protein LAJ19_03975 [Deinococcus taeanensis]|uniref:hypothetical protein n=1 Tax=Deinococcus taeanensis TaxID=2737050 RepID=UPI001CDC8D16|nr:hypothetical protein [Deinococcus taeanensis]UBV43379.1 hypothetical protein LAJ19_03975 [Deinococcus taeanensis]
MWKRWCLGALMCASTAGAQIHLGLSGSAGPVGTEGGVHASVLSAWQGGGRWRGTLGVSLNTRPSPFRRRPWLRADVTHLRSLGADRYAGVGVGTGLLLSRESTAGGLPLAVYSPLLAANLHGVYGAAFGGVDLEGALRLGARSSVEVRMNFPLR